MAIDYDLRDLGGPGFSAVLDAFPSMHQVTLDRAGKLYQLGLQDAIRRQTLPWAPIKTSTLKRKLRRQSPPSQFPTETWKDTGLLMLNIEHWGVGEGEEYEAHVGLREETVGEDRIIAAASLEHGTRRIRARPLFRPVADEMEQRLLQTVEYGIAKVLDDVERGRNP